MVKIRAFISKKSVPRGIDIDNKEYWQPFAITVKGKGGDGGDDDGDDDGGGGDDPQNTKCTINITTVPNDATIVATDSDNNVYTSKNFQVTKGKQVTVVATPNPSSTGYKSTTKVITSEQTNQDNLNYTLTLDANVPVEEKTTVTIVPNVQNVLTYVYSANGLLLNQNGSNIVQNVTVGSVISIRPSKEGYKLKTTSIGTITNEGGVTSIIGITVTKNLLVSISLEAISDEQPTIRNVESEYAAFSDAQDFIRGFKATFYKLRIYGDLPLTIATSWGTSSADSLGGQSITDVNQVHHGEQDVSFTIPLSENNTGLIKRYTFTIVAENKSGEQVAQQFVIKQWNAEVVKYTVSIVTKINNAVSTSGDIIRKIDGVAVSPGQEIEVGAGDLVTFYASYLGVEQIDSIVINENTVKTFNFTIVNIGLGTVTDTTGESFNTWKLDLNVPVLGITRNNWRGELIQVPDGTEYVVTGMDTSGQRPNYNSGRRIAHGAAIDVVFGVTAVDVKVIPINEQGNEIQNAIVKLKVGMVEYNNQSSFPNGTRVGYSIEAQGYEPVTISDSSSQAIVVGTTQLPLRVVMHPAIQYVDVTVITKLDDVVATGAKVYIDSQLVGTGSPFVVQNLVNGQSYNLKVELEDQIPHYEAFTATLNKQIEVNYYSVPTPPSKYSLGVTMLTPSDALIEVTDYDDDGRVYRASGQLYEQISANHHITIRLSKEGYYPRYMPANAEQGGRILMDGNKNYLDLTLEETTPLPANCNYSLNVSPSGCKIEFTEDHEEVDGQQEGVNYSEYPSGIYSTVVGRTVYWRVSKAGYVTQTGNSGVLSGSKTDNVTLVAEQPGVNNNVLFVVRSIKDKDTNEDITGVTVKLQLKGINQSDNRTITQSDIAEVIANPTSEWDAYIGKFGGVAAKGTDVKLLITKSGYENYNRWGDIYDNFKGTITISANYEDNVLNLDVIMQTPKCRFTLYPIQNMGGSALVPDRVYIKEGNDLFTEDDKVELVANRYSKEINRGADVYYLVLKAGYSGGKGQVLGVQYSISESVTLAAVSPGLDTVHLIVYGTDNGNMSFNWNDATPPIIYSLEDGTCYAYNPNPGGIYYNYEFDIPRNTLIKCTCESFGRKVSLIGSFSEDAEVLMWMKPQSNMNLRIYPMEQGKLLEFAKNNLNITPIDKTTQHILRPVSAGCDWKWIGPSYGQYGNYREGFTVNNRIPIFITASMDTYKWIYQNIGTEDVTTIYLDFWDNSVDEYLRVSVEDTNNWMNSGSIDVYFDGNGDAKEIHIQSNDDWVVE